MCLIDRKALNKTLNNDGDNDSNNDDNVNGDGGEKFQVGGLQRGDTVHKISYNPN